MIVAIGCFPDELILSCGGMLIKNAEKDDAEIKIILIENPNLSKKKIKIQEFIEKIRIKTHVVEGFDFSAITQNNVNLIQNIIRKYKPDTIIIPYNKSKKKENRILGSSSILAGREINNILMYEVGEKTDFSPTVFLDIKNVNKIKNNWFYSLDITQKSRLKKMLDVYNKTNKKYKLKIKFIEPHQSFRMVLD